MIILSGFETWPQTTRGARLRVRVQIMFDRSHLEKFRWKLYSRASEIDIIKLPDAKS